MRFDPYNDTALFIYKLETSDLPRGDILQIGVVMTALNMEGGAVDEFYMYVSVCCFYNPMSCLFLDCKSSL